MTGSMRDFFTSRVIQYWLIPNDSGDSVGDGWGPGDNASEAIGPLQGIVKTYSTSQAVQFASSEQLEASTVLFSFSELEDSADSGYDRVKIGDQVFSVVSRDSLPFPVGRIKSRIVLKKVL